MRIFLTGASGFIGTNLVAELKSRNLPVCNYDWAEPSRPEDIDVWVKGDILDAPSVERAIGKFAPDAVIHLAARTDCDENTTVEDGYAVNTRGTANVLSAVRACGGVRRLIVTSSQYVCGPGRLPEGDRDFFPHTVYGWSKVETERLTRSADLACTWTLIRPVNIWGPHHVRYAREFWRIAAAGLYLHPGVPAPVRTYGYIGNVVWQIMRILELPPESVHERVVYLGDEPIRIDRWSIGFCRALRGKDPLTIPLAAMKVLALGGDVISLLTRRPFYLTSSRLRSMTVDYVSPLDETVALLGEAPYSLDEAIKHTAEWYKGVRYPAAP
jgi:nucleoside-diphosphate-sugar epimerase